MRNAMKATGSAIFLLLTMSLISCSSGTQISSNGGAVAVSAPATVAGKTYRITVEAGSGMFAPTGKFTVTFLSSQPIYTKRGDGVTVGDSWGMYIYSASGDSGTLEIEDSNAPDNILSYSFTFNTAISGTYVATIAADVNSTQSGTFTE
jgi:hypothetical protein